MACLAVDPAILLMVVGILMFFITFCGCIGSLRENICLLQTFSCCGGISYKDWSQNMYFNCTAHNPSRERCSVPYSCCLQAEDQSVINTMCGQGMQALNFLEASEFIYTNGCIDKLVNWIHSNLFLLGGVALGLAIPQVLVNQIRDQIKLQLYNQQHRADPWY
ncbi:hypothetical protein JD844_029057 [Phrynosoma platyrhinos]|uniref:Tetraspanin n=1 Tax=Phrynosoma platyrhinos TaxID=52577 RepID=A0ABQ7SIL6_PHRPL|nr:hypothetical protein JD844_029057 [Phrynosoma platyrhinos]